MSNDQIDTNSVDPSEMTQQQETEGQVFENADQQPEEKDEE